jgi:hypothetical protein
VMTLATAHIVVQLGARTIGVKARALTRAATAVVGIALCGWTVWCWETVLDSTHELADLGYRSVWLGPPETRADAIVGVALAYPGWLTDAALAWLPLVALTAAMTCLANVSGKDRTPTPPTGAAAVIVVLFASFVGGPWGGIFSLPVPLTALVALAVLAPVVIRGYRRSVGARAASRRDAVDVLRAGPTGEWWGNGKRASRIGVLVALPFALHYLYLLFRAQGGDLITGWNPVGPLWALQWVAYEYAFWMVGAFALGALYTVLPFRTGIGKGAVLAGVFAISQGAGELLPGTFDVMSWPAIAAETLIVLAVSGVLLDAETLRRPGMGGERLLKVYRIDRWDTAAGLIPFAGAVVLLLAQQLISGDASRAITDLLEVVPTVGGGSFSR